MLWLTFRIDARLVVVSVLAQRGMVGGGVMGGDNDDEHARCHRW